MSLEIERKFLVKGEAWRGLAEPVRIRQGYVATKDGSARGGCLGFLLESGALCEWHGRGVEYIDVGGREGRDAV